MSARNVSHDTRTVCEMDSASRCSALLPSLADLSTSTLSFVNDHLSNGEDLMNSDILQSELLENCLSLDRRLVDLNDKLDSSIRTYVSASDQIGVILLDLAKKVNDLANFTGKSCSAADGIGGEESSRAVQILGDELPALAKEVSRIEAVRIYVETALKLDTLVGEVEDGVSVVMKWNLRRQSSLQNSEEHLVIRSLKLIEDVLTSVAHTRPHWISLVSSVDHRVDRALAVLRPQAVANYRSLLSSLGWPPPLTSSKPSSSRGAPEISNPFLTMKEELKQRYHENFLALCTLQELQRRRKLRQLEGYNREIVLHQSLWAIEELVNPISIACQSHFSKWIDKPEFIFGLVYKITRDYADSMDVLLQPLVDEAMLAGYSCREEWISAMIASLVTYLAKELFPILVNQLDNESDADVKSDARSSWLHLIDLILSFDKEMLSLIADSGIPLDEDGYIQNISFMFVFVDRPDWLDLWAMLERDDALEKLRLEIEDERKWTMKIQGTVHSGREDYKSAMISLSYIHSLSFVADRCRSLPKVDLRLRFMRLAGSPIVQSLIDCLLFRCEEAEGLTALADDAALRKVCTAINCARHFANTLKDWCDDTFFLEMESSQESGDGILDKETKRLDDFSSEWVEKLSAAVIRGFDARCQDYIRNKRQFQKGGEPGTTVSPSLAVALDYLHAALSFLEYNLNALDFVMVWRSVATGLDRWMFSAVLMSNSKFSDAGVEKFGTDMEALCTVFREWCLRPRGFFTKICEGLELMKMKEKQLGKRLGDGEKWMRENKVMHVTIRELEKIVRNRVFSGEKH